MDMRLILIAVAAALVFLTIRMGESHGMPVGSKDFWLTQGTAFAGGAILFLAVLGKLPKKEKK
jgi:hypothetical protein